MEVSTGYLLIELPGNFTPFNSTSFSPSSLSYSPFSPSSLYSITPRVFTPTDQAYSQASPKNRLFRTRSASPRSETTSLCWSSIMDFMPKNVSESCLSDCDVESTEELSYCDRIEYCLSKMEGFVDWENFITEDLNIESLSKPFENVTSKDILDLDAFELFLESLPFGCQDVIVAVAQQDISIDLFIEALLGYVEYLNRKYEDSSARIIKDFVLRLSIYCVIHQEQRRIFRTCIKYVDELESFLNRPVMNESDFYVVPFDLRGDLLKVFVNPICQKMKNTLQNGLDIKRWIQIQFGILIHDKESCDAIFVEGEKFLFNHLYQKTTRSMGAKLREMFEKRSCSDDFIRNSLFFAREKFFQGFEITYLIQGILPMAIYSMLLKSYGQILQSCQQEVGNIKSRAGKFSSLFNGQISRSDIISFMKKMALTRPESFYEDCWYEVQVFLKEGLNRSLYKLDYQFYKMETNEFEFLFYPEEDGVKVIGRCKKSEEKNQQSMSILFIPRYFNNQKIISYSLESINDEKHEQYKRNGALLKSSCIGSGLFLEMEYFSCEKLHFIKRLNHEYLTLQEILKTSSVSFEDRLDISLALIHALRIFHAVGFLHLDLHPQTVFIKKEQKKFLIKFGSCLSIKKIIPGQRFYLHIPPDNSYSNTLSRAGCASIETDVYGMIRLLQDIFCSKDDVISSQYSNENIIRNGIADFALKATQFDEFQTEKLSQNIAPEIFIHEGLKLPSLEVIQKFLKENFC